MVQIESETAEIFLIWTNVARTNVAWTNVSVTVQLKMVPGTYLKSLVKIGSVTAEIFMIWVNVARTNVAWTNYIVTVVICSIWSFKAWSNSGH